MTALGLNDQNRSPSREHVEPDQPGDVVGAAVGRRPRAAGRPAPACRRRAPARVGEGERVDGVVGDQQRDPVVRREVAGQLDAQCGGDPDVEARRTARRAAAARVGGQGPGDGDPLGLPAGQLARLAARRGRRRRTGRATSCAVRRAAARDGAARCAGRRRRCRGRSGAGRAAGPGTPCPTGPLARAGRPSPGPAVHHGPRPAAGDQPGEGAQQRRLAGAVRPDHRRRPAPGSATARRRAPGRATGDSSSVEAAHGRVSHRLRSSGQHADRHDEQHHAHACAATCGSVCSSV